MAPVQQTAANSRADIVGFAFARQYYYLLHRSPGQTHKFYNNISKLGRPDPNGVMTSVTTKEAINEQLLSLNYQKLRTEVNTIDSQESEDGGLIVVVTGCLIGENNVRKRFVQSFFLAPQSGGHFVLNDMFRCLDEPSLDNNQNPMEIKAMDTQLSIGGGLFVLATGFLTGRDNVRRSFVQSSFHALQQTPQGLCYFTLNDIFRYM